MPESHTLLIVDDCPEDREIYRDFLLDDPHVSYQFLEAPLAEAGLELFQNQACDAILLDFYMPDMTGLEFLSALKQQQPVVRPPIVMLTGQGNEAIAVEAIQQGIQDYLVKQHLQPEVLQLVVRNVIQQSNLHSLLNRTREQQRVVATTALRIRQSLDLDQILSTTLAEVQQLFECDYVAVYQCSEPPGSADAPLKLSQVKVRAALGTCAHPSEWVAAANHLFSQPAVATANYQGCYEYLVAPISVLSRSVAQEQVWGYLVVHQKNKRACWQQDEQAIIKELAVQLAIAIQQSSLLSDAQSALKKSQELIRFKSKIISTISHEYRTPLTAILGAASTLNRHYNKLSADKQNRLLSMVQEKSRLMKRLVDDMLMMHQCDLNQAKFEPSPMNLLEFVADLVEEYRESAGKQHEIVLQVSGRSRGFWGDRGLLRFAIGNILSNAIKYSPAGGTIEFSVDGKAEDIHLAIKDRGIGIPKVDQPALFKSFSRASNVDTISGTGLGLSIAKACVELHSGTISIESEVSVGTTVLIALPKEPPAMQNICQPDSV